ncbi:MAG TPA: tyrosine-type recombinase/integrase [Thermoanaerobaculia bacterium]|nr:tyrosine-type recombinase/integrase [Thermoanaerobaculia bacterium]
MLTDKRVRGLRTEEEREDLFDGKGGVPGFGVRVWGTGKKSFFLMYRAPEPGISARKRKLRRLKLGRYGGPPTGIGLAEARRRAKAALGDVAAGRDPGPQLARIKGGAAAAVRVGVAGRLAEFLPEGYALGSFGQLAAEYLSQHAWAKKRDPLPDERALRYRLLPLWADTPLSEIDRRRVVVYLDEVREASGPVAANRRQALLSKMWNFGLQRDLVSTNPVVGISKNRETPKDRYLAEDELRKLLPALEGDAAHRVARLILLTGMRPGEVIGMRWCDLEGEDWYNLPAKDAKNGIGLRVYLSEPARAILRAQKSLQKVPTAPHVFYAPNGKPLSSVRKSLLEVRTATGIDFTPHDLRRTCATHLGRLGFSDLVPEVLNHKPKGVTSIYNRYRFDKEKQGALTAWAQELHRIVAA